MGAALRVVYSAITALSMSLQSRSILLQARKVFQDLAEENPNKANMADYIEAILQAR